MSLFPEASTWISILTGGGVAALVGHFLNWRVKRREEEIDLYKEKINIISKAAPYYNQLGISSWNFSIELQKKTPDYKLTMYHICSVLQMRVQIRQLFGDLQFDSLEAEEIINDLGRSVAAALNDKFDALEYSKMSYITKNNLPYHEFHKAISDEYNDLYQNFEKWLSEEKGSEKIKKLERESRWYSQLIFLELNHVYRIWYGEEPRFTKLHSDLREYLYQEKRQYHNRVVGFETGKRR